MSQEEINNNFSFERKKHIEFFLPYYAEKNWIVIEDNIDSNHKNDWDVKLEIFGGEYVTIDEKALRKDGYNLLVEMIQDVKTGNLGWFFSQKDWILYASFEGENNHPNSLYLVKSKELKEYICGLDSLDNIRTCISKRGWGITWNAILDWNNLIKNNIAEKLI